jgi:hypothetical protein
MHPALAAIDLRKTQTKQSLQHMHQLCTLLRYNSVYQSALQLSLVNTVYMRAYAISTMLSYHTQN